MPTEAVSPFRLLAGEPNFYLVDILSCRSPLFTFIGTLHDLTIAMLFFEILGPYYYQFGRWLGQVLL